MRNILRLLVAIFALAGYANAQSGPGQLPALNVVGNPTGAPAPPTAFPIFSTANIWGPLQTFQNGVAIGTTGLGNIGQPGTGISVGSSLFPSITSPLNTTVTATGSSSPNITVPGGVASQIANGDTITGAVVPGNCCYFVQSGGGTTSIVMSGNATGAGALAATFGVVRYNSTSSFIANTIGAENLWVGAASQRFGSWAAAWDTPYPFPLVNPFQSVSPNGARAAGFYCRQSDNVGASGIPSCETVVNTTLIDAVSAAGSWSEYKETDISVAGAAGHLQVEADIWSQVSNATTLASATPFNYNGVGHTSIYRHAAGAGRVGGNNLSTGAEFINNNNVFEVAVLCGNGALDTSSNRVGQCASMANGQGLAWSHTPGGIAATAGLIGGGGGTPGTYTAVPLTGGSGSGAQATIVVGVGGFVTGVTVTTPGTGYVVGDTPSALAANIGGTSGFRVTVIGLTSILDATLWSNFNGSVANLNIGIPSGGSLQLLNGSASNSPVVVAFQAGGAFPAANNAYTLGVQSLGWSNVVSAQFQAGIIYSAAGTALPSCAAGTDGSTAVVSDATGATYAGAYTSGGAQKRRVLCVNGTGWITN